MTRTAKHLVALLTATCSLLGAPGLAHAARYATSDHAPARAAYEVRLVSIEDSASCDGSTDFSQAVKVCEVEEGDGVRTVRCWQLELPEAGSSVSFGVVKGDENGFEVSSNSSYYQEDLYGSDNAVFVFKTIEPASSGTEPFEFTQTIAGAGQCERTYHFEVVAR